MTGYRSAHYLVPPSHAHASIPRLIIFKVCDLWEIIFFNLDFLLIKFFQAPSCSSRNSEVPRFSFVLDNPPVPCRKRFLTTNISIKVLQ